MTSLDHCNFFVERKKRYCRMTVKKGKQFCGEHQSVSKDLKLNINNERIACPLDPNHTCYKSKLSKHLKVCNAKIKQTVQPPYVVKGINLGHLVSCLTDTPLSIINQKIIDDILTKINIAYDKLPDIPQEILIHSELEKELNNPLNGTEAKRHLLQTASLLGHLENVGLVSENTGFIEFGAGRGKLTYWLAQVIKNQANSSILLIDRASHRHKRDNKLRNDKVNIKVTRVRVDIADLKLNNVPELQNVHSKVAIAKHICGVASDLTLRCMTNSIQSNQHSKIGIVIAFCCHHRCEYSHYVGHKYLENQGFTKDEFPILCKIASWATCGIKQIDETNPSEREIMGRKMKILLNWGRLEYLKTFGFHCRLVHYTTTKTTLENVCIIATLSNEKSMDKV